MLDFSGGFNISIWLVATVITGFFFCVWFSFASLISIANKDYSKSTIAFSVLITGLTLLCYYLGAIYPNNFFLLFIPIFTFSFDILIFTAFGDNLPTFVFCSLAVFMKFFLAFGFVSTAQKLLNKYFV